MCAAVVGVGWGWGVRVTAGEGFVNMNGWFHVCFYDVAS